MKKIITSFIYNGKNLTYYLEIDHVCKTFLFTPARGYKDFPEFSFNLENNKFSSVNGVPHEIYEQAVAEVKSLLAHKIPEQINQLIHDSFSN